MIRCHIASASMESSTGYVRRKSFARTSSKPVVPVEFTSRLCSSVGDLSVLSDKNLCIGGRRWRRSMKSMTSVASSSSSSNSSLQAVSKEIAPVLRSMGLTNTMTRGPDFHDMRMYFVGTLSRARAATYLKHMPMGTFIVRDGSSGLVLTAKIPILTRHDNEASTVNDRGYLSHIRMNCDDYNSKCYLHTECRFETMGSLVQYYMDNPRMFFINLSLSGGNEIDFRHYNGMLIPLRVARLCIAIEIPWTRKSSDVHDTTKILRQRSKRFLMHIMLVAQRLHRLESSHAYRQQILSLPGLSSGRDSACECEAESSDLYLKGAESRTIVHEDSNAVTTFLGDDGSDDDGEVISVPHRVSETKSRAVSQDSGRNSIVEVSSINGDALPSLPHLPLEMWLLVFKQFRLSDFLSYSRESSGVQCPAFFDSKTTPLWWYSMDWFLDESIQEIDID
eukprot:m.656486 g.656486  ORF g.656486 m.656486 type:complete len:449 (-) comp22704_c0_seq2:1807-3153(-)